MMTRLSAKSVDMYGVSRIDDEKYRTHSWRVSLSREGTKLVKNFPDRKYGDTATALQSALAFRDKLLKRYPPISRKKFCNAKRRNNKTGITGVYTYNKPYTTKDGRSQDNWYWEANWPTVEGQSAKKSFSVKKLGDEFAKQSAIRARKEGLKKVEGTFWASKRGAIAHVKEASATATLPRSDQVA